MRAARQLLVAAALPVLLLGAEPAEVAEAPPVIAQLETECAGGALVACVELGRRHAEGEGVPRDLKRAVAIWSPACDKGADEACLDLDVIEAPPSFGTTSSGRRLPDLRRSLRSPEWRQREEAASAIGHLGPAGRPAIPDLVRTLSDPQSDVRTLSASALASTGPPSTTRSREIVRRALTAALDGSTGDAGGSLLARAVAMALGGYGEPAVPELVRILEDPRLRSGQEALRSLGSIGSAARAAVPAIVKVARQAQTTDSSRFLEAAIALSRISPSDVEEFLPSLERAMREHDDPGADSAPFRAAQVLARSGRPRAGVAFLARVARDREAGFTDRLAALEALESLGPLAAPSLPALKAILRDEREDVRVRDAAAAALGAAVPGERARLMASLQARDRARAAPPHALPSGRLGALIRQLSASSPEQRVRAADGLRDPVAIPWLIDRLDDGEYVSIPTEDFSRDTTPADAAAAALGAIGMPAVEGLAMVLARGSAAAQGRAAGALGSIGGDRAVALLGEAVLDTRRDVAVRRAAAAALGATRHKAAPDLLARALDDTEVGPQAARSLAEFGDPRGAAILTEVLRTGDPLDRPEAAMGLAKVMDPAGLDVLLTRARESCTPGHFMPAHMECTAVAQALAAWRDPRAVPALLDAREAVGENDTCARNLDVALYEVGPPAWSALVEALKAEAPARRLAAIGALWVSAQIGQRHGAASLASLAAEDPEPEVRRKALGALLMYGRDVAVDAALRGLPDPAVRPTALRMLGEPDLHSAARQTRVVDQVLARLEDADRATAVSAITALRAITGHDAGSDPSAWRAWWEETRPAWGREEAFRARTLRVTARLRDVHGEPMGGRVVAVCRRDGMDMRGANAASSCGKDEFGTLALLFDGDQLVNPATQTDADGRFAIVDARHFLAAGEMFSLFVAEARHCARVPVRGQPWLAVGLDDDVIDLGDLSPRVSTPTPRD